MRQPDWILVSEEHKKIAIVDLCRPSDVHHAQLLAVAIQNQETYCPLEEALGYYTDKGWIVHVGIRGMIDPSHVESLLKYLSIQRKHWWVAVDQIALASVRAFHFLHKLRFWGPLEAVHPDLDPDNGYSASDEEVGVAVTKRMYRRNNAGPSPDGTDS